MRRRLPTARCAPEPVCRVVGTRAHSAPVRPPRRGATGSGVGCSRAAVGLLAVSTFRESLERASLPLLNRLSRLPRAVPFLLVLALLVGGILIPGWGWVLTALVALFLLWMLVLGWPRLSGVERLMRVAVVFLAVAIAVSQAIPRT